MARTAVQLQRHPGGEPANGTGAEWERIEKNGLRTAHVRKPTPPGEPHETGADRERAVIPLLFRFFRSLSARKKIKGRAERERFKNFPCRQKIFFSVP